MNNTNLPYGSGSVIHMPQNTLHSYCARRYSGNNQNGNPQYRIIGYYATYEEARQALADAMDQSEEDLSRADMTFREVFDHFLESGDDLAQNTRNAYKGTARKYCSQLMDVKYREIRADDMREAIRMAQSTKMKRSVKGVFMATDREAEILSIPGKRYAQLLQSVRRRQTDARPDRMAFPDEVLQQFLAHSNDQDMYIVLFLCYTGFRQGAFRTIRKENVNLEKMTVTGGIKTQAGYMREVPIHPNIQPIVKEMMQKPGEYLLSNESGNAMGENEMYARFQMAIAPYTDRHYVLHECRHTFRTKLDEQKVEEYILCALMGHEMPTAGQRHYAKVTIEKKREAIMKLWEKCPEDSQRTRRDGQSVNQSGSYPDTTWWNDAATSVPAPALRNLFETYMEKNPSCFGKDLLFRFRSSSGHFRQLMDMKYSEITDDMFEAAICGVRSDLSRTELRFLIRQFDRVAER